MVLDGAEAGESEQSEAAVVMQMLYDGGRLQRTRERMRKRGSSGNNHFYCIFIIILYSYHKSAIEIKIHKD